MAVEPNLPIPPKEASAYDLALNLRLTEILRDVMRPIDYETGQITILAGSATGTATLKKKARYVAMTGSYITAVVGSNQGNALLTLGSDLKTITATRAVVGAFDLIVGYIAIR